MNLYEPVSALSFVKRLSFPLICFSPSMRGERVWYKRHAECSTAVSFKSCTSCTDLGFTRLATTISRKINYDVTQSRPEGAARLHTPKTCSTLSSLTTRKQKLSNRAGVHRRGERERGEGAGTEGRGGIFSFSYIDDSNIPPASKSPRWSRSSTGNSFVWNSTAGAQTGACARFPTACAPSAQKRHTHTQNSRHWDNHTPNKQPLCAQTLLESEMRIWQQSYHSLKAKNTAEVCLWVREGIGSLSKYPHT